MNCRKWLLVVLVGGFSVGACGGGGGGTDSAAAVDAGGDFNPWMDGASELDLAGRNGSGTCAGKPFGQPDAPRA